MNTNKIIKRLIMSLNLHSDIVNYILEMIDCHKNRKGKYMVQLNKNCDIYNKLEHVPLIDNWHVSLPIKTAWFRKSFCDKRITLYALNIINNTYTNDNEVSDEDDNNLVRVYDCSWYEQDFDNSMHKIKTEEKHYVYI